MSQHELQKACPHDSDEKLSLVEADAQTSHCRPTRGTEEDEDDALDGRRHEEEDGADGVDGGAEDDAREDRALERFQPCRWSTNLAWDADN